MEIGETLIVETAAAWRAWLEAHHATRAEIWLVTFRRSQVRHGLAQPAAKDEALCFGWVDGRSEPIDQDCFATRWTPRVLSRPWSELDQGRARRLFESGQMTWAGLAALPPRLRAELSRRPHPVV